MLISKNFLTREASYKPSYLISWNHSGRAGTTLPAVGRRRSDGERRQQNVPADDPGELDA
jgi:hypothetical protein